MKALIIAAHPDDEVLGCAGIIAKMRNSGIDPYVLIMTNGAAGRYPGSMRRTLKECAKKANKMLGTKKVFFENLPNQRLDDIPFIKVIRTIEGRLEAIKPEAVFTHHAGDLNKDHRIINTATMTAVRPLPGGCVRRVYAYLVPSSSEWNMVEGENIFIPNTFVDIKEELELKIEAMKAYKSECREYPHPRSPEAIRVYSAYWGLIAGLEYAEPFKLIRDISQRILK